MRRRLGRSRRSGIEAGWRVARARLPSRSAAVEMGLTVRRVSRVHQARTHPLGGHGQARCVYLACTYRCPEFDEYGAVMRPGSQCGAHRAQRPGQRVQWTIADAVNAQRGCGRRAGAAQETAPGREPSRRLLRLMRRVQGGKAGEWPGLCSRRDAPPVQFSSEDSTSLTVFGNSPSRGQRGLPGAPRREVPAPYGSGCRAPPCHAIQVAEAAAYIGNRS